MKITHPSQITETRRQILADSYKRLFIERHLFRKTLNDIRTSETLIFYREQAKQNKARDFVDLTVVAADTIRHLDSMIPKMMKVIEPGTWNDIKSALSEDYINSVHVIIDKITYLSDDRVDKVVEYIEQLLKEQRDANNTSEN
jgi:hypothetical protein